LMVAAEVSERDEIFVRKVAGPEGEEWWHGDNEENYPPYGEVLNIISMRVQEVCMDFYA
jgi:hypothetical protein